MKSGAWSANSPLVASREDCIVEMFAEVEKGNALWVTLFSGDRTPTSGMSAGLMTVPGNGGFLAPHRHRQAELYYFASGRGTLQVDSATSIVRAGQTAFIQGDTLHGLRNDNPEDLVVFYVFLTDCFSDIAYRFAAG